MTTIRPRTGGIALQVKHIGADGYALINVGPLPKPFAGGYTSEQSARYPVADLLAALGAVDKVDVVAAERAADEWTARYQAERNSHDATRRALAEAEATIERVREVVVEYRPAWPRLMECFDEAFDPAPAFVLPTEAGAMFEALNGDGTVAAVFSAIQNGPDITYLNIGTWTVWSGENVLSGYADHRLLGAAE